jgi:hypothetical protein
VLGGLICILVNDSDYRIAVRELKQSQRQQAANKPAKVKIENVFDINRNLSKQLITGV